MGLWFILPVGVESVPSIHVGWSLARVTCETSQVLLAGGQVVFLGGSPVFCLTLRLTWLKMSEIILTGHKTLIKIK